MGHRLGVDVGGTFTDVQMQDTNTGDVTLVQVLSTPSDESVGVLEGVREACRRTGASPKDLQLARQFDVVDAIFSNALEQFAVTGGYGTLRRARPSNREIRVAV